MKGPLYLITNSGYLKEGEDYFNKVGSILKGGINICQYRSKKSSDQEFIKEALKIKEICRANKTTFIVNDRIHLHSYIDADGYHVGQSDESIYSIRKKFGKNLLLGLSVENKSQYYESQTLDLNYVSLSPVFKTNSKYITHKEWGWSGVEWACKNKSKALCGIGGIKIKDIEALLHLGIDYIAMIEELYVCG